MVKNVMIGYIWITFFHKEEGSIPYQVKILKKIIFPLDRISILLWIYRWYHMCLERMVLTPNPNLAINTYFIHLINNV